MSNIPGNKPPPAPQKQDKPSTPPVATPAEHTTKEADSGKSTGDHEKKATVTPEKT